MHLLSLDSSKEFLLQRRLAQDSQAGSTPKIPRRVVQYWDRNPPAQIQRLLERNQALCAEAKVEHVLFDEAQARAYLASHDEPQSLAAYDIAVHPAMKCDVFRLAYLFFDGGHYVDADIVLRPDIEQMLMLPGDVLVYQWDSRDLTNLCNWLIGARAGDPTMKYAMQATAWNVLRACRNSPEDALKNILGVSGPGIFTRGIATDLQRRYEASPLQAAAVHIETVSKAQQQLTQLGPVYLKAPLTYKSDERHWKAATGEPHVPASTNGQEAKPVASSWISRMAAKVLGDKH